jgi:Rrf2 family protein
MLKLGKKVEYALIALVHCSEQEKSAPVSARELADKNGLPPEIVGKVMQRLAKSGLLESVRGANGGYILLKELNTIDLGSVIQAAEGTLRVGPCTQGGHCPQSGDCTIEEPIIRFQNRLLDFLYGISLDSLVDSDMCRLGQTCTPETCSCS